MWFVYCNNKTIHIEFEIVGQNGNGFERSVCTSKGHTREGKVEKLIAMLNPLPEPRGIASKQHGIRTDPVAIFLFARSS